MFQKNIRGFTLIELLTVIAIIGILASIIMASLSAAQGKGRDSKRITDLHNIQLALSEYYNDNNAYPISASNGTLWEGNCLINQNWGVGSLPNSGSTGWIPNLAPTYLSTLPDDPRSNTNSCYLYRSSGSDYMILAYNTVESYTQATNPYPRPSQSGLNGTTYLPDFALYTPGAVGW